MGWMAAEALASGDAVVVDHQQVCMTDSSVGTARREVSSVGVAAVAVGIQAQGAGAEGGHLQQPAGDRQVLQEVDELVLVAQLVVEGQGRRHRKAGHHHGDEAGAVAD